MQSLKVICEETNTETLELIRTALEATGKFIVVIDASRLTRVTRTFGQFLFNLEMRTLQWKDNNPVQITGRESQVLLFLLEHANRVVTRRRILSSLWKEESEYTSRSLDIFIHRLRQKLKKDPMIVIHTIRGEGFMLTC
jgi:DNA-binding response OmpR family regulator